MSKLVNCKACQKEIAKGVKKCPSCGKDQRNFFGKHKILTGVIVLAVLYGIGTAGNSDTPVATNETASKSTSAPVAETKAPVKEFWAIGEGVKQDDVALVVSEVKKSNGGEYSSLKAGNEYVIVTVHIKNTGTGTVSYNPFDFKMQNSKGQITGGTFAMENQDTALSSGDLAGGGEVSGTLIYEQPKDDAKLVLIYTGNMFSTEGVKFKLN